MADGRDEISDSGEPFIKNDVKQKNRNRARVFHQRDSRGFVTNRKSRKSVLRLFQQEIEQQLSGLGRV